TAGLTVAALAIAASANVRRQANGEQPPNDRVATTGEVSAESPPWRAALAAGAFIGLAVAAKVTAVIALPFVILLVAGWRTRRRATTAIAIAALTVTATGALVFAAASLAAGLDLGWFGALSDTGSLVQWTSLPTGVGMAVGYLLRVAGWPGAVDTAVYVARICGVGALALIGLGLCWRALQATLRGRLTNEQPDEKRTELTAAPAGAGSANHDALNSASAPAPTNHRQTRQENVAHEPDASAAHRRQVVAAAGWTLAAAAILLPVFYPWYAIAPLAVLACATPPGKTRTALAATAIAISALIIPNGLGLAVLTKLPGAILDVAIVAAIAYRFRSRRGNHGDPVPADGER
ncbi:MAG TPA: polyprenol phosphomannose-dependent alpha 1,6 mannosyltransferase MptB, partial [Asanoa sp.]|nr:polyprenol phosphomannose-dependent alpha 1,6 mannosyltransferase MptB [Asanoa sp.]